MHRINLAALSPSARKCVIETLSCLDLFLDRLDLGLDISELVQTGQMSEELKALEYLAGADVFEHWMCDFYEAEYYEAL